MSLPAMQRRVAAFTARTGLDTGIPFRALDLASETGELAKEVLKATAYGREPFTPTGDWSAELADTLFALLCLGLDRRLIVATRTSREQPTALASR